MNGLQSLVQNLPSATSLYEPLIDSGYVPDVALRLGIRGLLLQRSKEIEGLSVDELDKRKNEYIARLKGEKTIAIATKEANEQHYELPTEFFRLCLGKRFKYSSCYFGEDVGKNSMTLDEAEEAMLDLYVQRAQVQDGMTVLDLGCGWGSLSLYLAERFPRCTIKALSNSATQRQYIMGQAAALGFNNLEVFTGDINEFEMTAQFDRILSIEMFEHMKNYQELFHKVSQWLKPETGLLFIHVFAHRSLPYDFVTTESNSWMAKHFFTGGTMPSQDLFMWFQRDLEVVRRWTVDGKHYGQTSEEWLKRLDKNKKLVMPLLKDVYGNDEQANIWFQRWRLFYLSVAETFNFANGQDWVVMHYLLKRH